MEITYIVQYHPLVVREDIPKIDRGMRDRIQRNIESKIMTHPDLFGIPLRRSLKGYRKLRVGDYRIVFRLERRMVFILIIDHRSSVYVHLDARMTSLHKS